MDMDRDWKRDEFQSEDAVWMCYRAPVLLHKRLPDQLYTKSTRTILQLCKIHDMSKYLIARPWIVGIVSRLEFILFPISIQLSFNLATPTDTSESPSHPVHQASHPDLKICQPTT
jgi:hypothetical protein